MDLGLIEDMIVTDAGEHPSRRRVTLETDNGSTSVENAIKRGMPRDWQQGGSAIMDGTWTTFVLLRRYCTREPHVGAVLKDGDTRWAVRQVDHEYGGIAYRCACLLLV